MPSCDEDRFDEAVNDVRDALEAHEAVSYVSEVTRSYEDGEVMVRIDVVWDRNDPEPLDYGPSNVPADDKYRGVSLKDGNDEERHSVTVAPTDDGHYVATADSKQDGNDDASGS